MKKILFLFLLLLATTVLSAQSREVVLEGEVPKVVVDNFYKQSNIKQAVAKTYSYDKKKRSYSIQFYKDGLSAWYYFLEDGTFLSFSRMMLHKDMPAKIADYLKDKRPEALVMALYQINQNNTMVYQVRVSEEKEDAQKGYSQRTKSYEFAADGGLIKTF